MIMLSPLYANQGLSRKSYVSIGERQHQGKLKEQKVGTMGVALGPAAL
jgi:hypothetical protein